MPMLLDKDTDLEIIQSPLNYTGGKFKLLPQILPLFPKNIDVFVDLFCGGANVGVNVKSNRTILNDTDDNLTYLFNMFKNLGSDCLSLLDEIIELMEKNSRLVQEQFYTFEMHMKKLEYYRKQIEYEYSLANYKESEYEM